MLAAARFTWHHEPRFLMPMAAARQLAAASTMPRKMYPMLTNRPSPTPFPREDFGKAAYYNAIIRASGSFISRMP